MSDKHSTELKTEEYVKGITDGDRTTLAKAITLVESNSAKHFNKAQKIIETLVQHEQNDSIRIGITGVPGVGKSTFIDVFGTFLCELGYKVAVLSIDPTSQISRGSILGDKTRMEKLAKHPHAFIRPSPSGGNLGGVGRKTRESIILCEAAGYHVILIETIGVGQSEFAVRDMVDFFMLLVLSDGGDDLQRLKKGIMELTDLIVVGKADGENKEKALQVKHQYNMMLHFFKPYTKGWTTNAVTASSLMETGISDIWEIIKKFEKVTKKTKLFYNQRRKQQSKWLHDLVHEELVQRFYRSTTVEKQLSLLEMAVMNREKSVAASAIEIVNEFLSEYGSNRE